MGLVKFRKGLFSNYNILTTKDVDTLYYCTDTQQIFLGDTEYSRPILSGEGIPTTTPSTDNRIYIDTSKNDLYVHLKGTTDWIQIGNADFSTRISTLEDKVEIIENKPAYNITSTQITNWDNEVGAKQDVINLDNSLADIAKSGKAEDVSVTDSTGVFIATNVEDASIELKSDISTLSDDSKITITKSNPEGISARYTFSQGGQALSTTIDIPKDLVVKSGSVVTDYDEQHKGTWIRLELQNSTDILWINVNDLIQYVTAGDDTATGHVEVSADHKVTMNVIAGSISSTYLDTITNAKLSKVDSIAEGATKTESSTTNGNIKINGTEVKVYELPSDVVQDDNYKHITVTSTSVSDGTTTFNKYELPEATSTILGGVKIGNNINVNNGTISVSTATTSDLGVVKVGDNLSVSNGVISGAYVFNTTYNASTNKVATMADVESANLVWGTI